MMRMYGGRKRGIAIAAAAALVAAAAWYGYTHMTGAALALRACPGDAHHVQCLSDLLQKTYKEQGASQAFALFKELYDADPSFVAVCHDMTHGLGTAGYDSYERGEPFVLRDDYTNCGYGFYHGFLEALVGHTGQPADAHAFCEQLIANMHNAESVRAACFHGFGHGVTDGSDPRLWGSEQSIVDPGLALCKRITTGEQELQYCAGGVYNSLAYMYKDPKYKISIDSQDPLKFCRAQATALYRSACYQNFNVVVSKLLHNDFSAILRVVAAIPEKAVAQQTVTQFAGYQAVLHLDPAGDASLAAQCLGLELYLQTPCIQGLVGGFMHAAQPGKEYARTLEFCRGSGLAGDNRALCFSTLTHIVKLQFAPAVYEEICKEVAAESPAACAQTQL